MPVGQHINELLAAYALECLDEAEKEEVARHLVHCEKCQSELEAYQEVTALLPLGALSVDPPPDFKARLMAQVQNQSRPNPQTASSTGWIERFLHWTHMAAPVWGTVSLLLVLVLGISNLLLWEQVHQLQTAQTSSMQFVPMAGTTAAPGASGVIVISRDGEHGTLVVDNMPPLQQGQQYQLWLINGEQRTDGGVFSVDLDGYGSLWVRASKPLVNYPTFGVTIEPKGGSPGPTGQKVLGGGL